MHKTLTILNERCECMKRNIIDGKNQQVALETILLHDIENIITKYKKKSFRLIVIKQYSECEKCLSDFCFELFDLSDEEQVFVARIFFTSFMTDLMKVQTHKNQLHPKSLAYVFKIVSMIDSLENITEYILFIPRFLQVIRKHMIGQHLLIEGNIHVEKILQLIDEHLKNRELSVQWLAKQMKLSTTHISNIFKQFMDRTIAEYISMRRIDEIAYHLRRTSKPIKQIKEIYGFVNESHFIRRFKQFKGMTPLQYRKKYFKVEI